METRRTFLQKSSALTIGAALWPSLGFKPLSLEKNLGVQLYTFRKDMLSDPEGTLEKIAALGIKKIESAGSEKGYYYGMKPEKINQVCTDLGMQLVSGHVQLDDDFSSTIADAAASGQDYLICSSLPSWGQNQDNYKRVAEQFNAAGEACKKMGIKFGYHNHEYEFDSENGKVLYDLLMEETDPNLVYMELDLGWVIAAGKDPIDYFNRYSGRFPLWHLKDMDLLKKESTEFGKGGLNIPEMWLQQEKSGVDHIFIEQEEYHSTPWESMQHNMRFMEAL